MTHRPRSGRLAHPTAGPRLHELEPVTEPTPPAERTPAWWAGQALALVIVLVLAAVTVAAGAAAVRWLIA